jgi:nitric oxide synthase-interacting protein
MGKHSKNNNERPFFSNAERKAAAYGRHASSMLGGHNAGANFTEWGWGTERAHIM